MRIKEGELKYTKCRNIYKKINNEDTGVEDSDEKYNGGKKINVIREQVVTA